MNKQAKVKIIEMVGLGGAGKSSLRNLLTQKNEKIRTLEIPNKIRYLPFVAKTTFQWMPLYLQSETRDRWFTMEEIRAMGRLDEWLTYIQTLPRSTHQAVMIDPGSACWLTMLKEFGPALTKHPRYARWWEDRLDQWAASIDMIVWLDAPEELLLKRILARDEWHEAKEQQPDVALARLRIYRNWYERLVPEMAKRYPIKVFRYRTDQISTEEIANQILPELDLGN